MWRDHLPAFTTASVGRMLAFLPAFERGEFADATGHFLRTGRDLPQVNDLRVAVYRSGFVLAFDWQTWKRAEGPAACRPDALARAGLTDLRKVLSAVVRQDRFFEGFVSRTCSDGLVRRVLERLRVLRGRPAE